MRHTATRCFNLTASIIAYEAGELDDDDMITLFQHLLDTGTVYCLQGHYQRTASQLLHDGLISLP